MDKAILRTLAYADIFCYPLKKSEIWAGLIYRGPLRDLSRRIFDETLRILVKERLIGNKQNYYFLSKRETLVSIRNHRKTWSEPKSKRARQIARYLSLIPWVKFIGISGSLAKENATINDDIDLFFIICNNRLWLSRGMIVVILMFLGKYRRSLKIRDMICPNMFISDTNLIMGPKNLYIASEICAIKPLVNKDMAYEAFITKNNWVKKFLPNFKIPRPTTKSEAGNHNSGFMNIIDNLAMKIQLLYMRKRLTREIVLKNLIKFHPNDLADNILKEFQQKIRETD